MCGVMMIEGIILDYDGTAANTVPWFHRQLQHALQAHFGLSISIEQIQEETRPIFENMPDNVHNARKYLIKAWYRVGRNRRLNPLKSLWLVYKTGTLTRSSNEIPPMTDGLKELLNWCQTQNVKCALVSLSSKTRVLKFLKHHDILHHFKPIFTKDQLGKTKQAAFDKIVSYWNVNPENVIAVGDLPGDAIAARKNKLRPCLISTGFASREFLEKTNLAPVISNFHQLLDMIRK